MGYKFFRRGFGPMNCHNCDIEIPWDGFSPIVVCEICRSYRFVDVPDDTADRIVSLELPGVCFCPGCRRRLGQAAMDGLKVEHCAECEGVLMTSDLLAMFVRNRRAEFRDAALQPVVIIPEDQSDVRCPNCRRTMDAHPCYGPNSIIVDSCSGCGMVWLDCREMTVRECFTL